MKKLIIFTVISSIFLMSCGTTKPAEAKPVAPVQEEIETDEEYARSTAGVSISREEFNADKSEILKIIEDLSEIMAKHDYNKWVTYIEPESVSYWSSPKNLKNASKRLPNKVALANLNDYFTFVFVPSRKGRSVEEIRYLSRDSVKAVQMREDRDIVYYNFKKIDGKWMVAIPSLSD